MKSWTSNVKNVFRVCCHPWGQEQHSQPSSHLRDRRTALVPQPASKRVQQAGLLYALVHSEENMGPTTEHIWTCSSIYLLKKQKEGDSFLNEIFSMEESRGDGRDGSDVSGDCIWSRSKWGRRLESKGAGLLHRRKWVLRSLTAVG